MSELPLFQLLEQGNRTPQDRRGCDAGGPQEEVTFAKGGKWASVAFEGPDSPLRFSGGWTAHLYKNGRCLRRYEAPRGKPEAIKVAKAFVQDDTQTEPGCHHNDGGGLGSGGGTDGLPNPHAGAADRRS